MATFTWQPTTGTAAWHTTGAAGWGGTPNFTKGTDSFVVGGTGTLVIDQISPGTTNDAVATLTVNNPNATLVLDPAGGIFTVTSALVLNAGTFDLNASTSSVLSLSLNSAIALGPTAVLTARAGADVAIESTSAEIHGTGTIVAPATGKLNISAGVVIGGGAGDNLHLQINTGGTLEIDDAVSNATISFQSTSGNGQLSLNGALPDGLFPATISGLQFGATRNELDFDAAVTTVNSAVLTNQSASGANLIINNTNTFSLLGNYTGASVAFRLDNTTDPMVPVYEVTVVLCFGPGTLIETPDGQVAVETIRPGDAVVTVEGGRRVPRAVTWVGRRRLDLTRHPKPDTVAPVRVRAGALGENLPRRDLLLSPDHALHVDGVLIPAKRLTNGMTIVREQSLSSITYYHVELERHTLLLAEGVETESYLDIGNRDFFEATGGVLRLYPEFGLKEDPHRWETEACAPLMLAPSTIAPAWRRFVERAARLGYTGEGTIRVAQTRGACDRA